MTAALEYIAIDETTRLAVYADDDYQNDVDESIREEVQELIDAGEVYGVEVQHLRTWALLAEDGTPTDVKRGEWEAGDSIWGCFLDDTYTARVVASEHFGIPAVQS